MSASTAPTTAPQKARKGPVIEPALCRCCRSIKKCRLLTSEYEWMGTKEVYSDMIMDCFGLLLTHLDGDEKESCICATCVTRLREAYAFRKQVLHWEEALIQAKLEVLRDDDNKFEIEVKAEPLKSDDESLHDDWMDGGNSYNNDSEDTKIAFEIKPVKKSKSKQKETKTKSKSTKKNESKDAHLKKKLLNEIKKVKNKLKEQLECPIDTQAAPATRQERLLDQEQRAYANAVTIVKNSYVCPFTTRVSNYYCYYCRDQFLEPTELRSHTLTHDPKVFTDMMINKKLPKIDITRIDCRLCTEKIDDLATLKRHLVEKHDKLIHPDVDNEFLKFRLTPNSLTCTECHSIFPYFDVLIKHMAEHFGTYTCDTCGACFLESCSLNTHIRKHNKPTDVHFPCEICGKELKSKYSRYLHVATVHEKKATVDCYKCDESFLSHALRNKHLIEAHGDNRTFACKLCDKVYNRRKTLMEHNRRNHLKVLRHQCSLCDQKFYLPSRLKEHMVTHTGERNYRCEYCEKSYPRLKTLKEHIRTHTNDRRFKCDICNSTFTQNGSLRSHMKSHHQGFEMEAGFN